MKVAAYVLVGALAGFLIAIASVYLLGVTVEAIGIRLYYSEADQQRNFNVAFAFVIGCALLGGWMGYRRHRIAR